MSSRCTMRSFAVLVACLLVAACTKESSGAESQGDAHAAGSDWALRCVGYLLISVPSDMAVVDVGEGYSFPDGLKGLPGDQRIGSVVLAESRPVSLERFRERTVEGSRHYYQGFILGEYSGARRLKDYATEVQELKFKDPLSIGWRRANKFVFFTWRQEDGRERGLEGRMSDDPAKDKGSAERALQMVNALWPRYKVRAPDHIPTEPGLCTPYGFVSAPTDRPEEPFIAHLPHRRQSQPAVVYTVHVSPSEGLPPRLEDLPQPWRETREEAVERRRQDKERGNWLSIGPAALVEKYLEPEFLTVAGQRARLSGAVFRRSMDQYDYEVQIETLGDPADPLKPRIMLIAQGLKASYYPVLEGKLPAPPLEQVLPTLKLMAQSMRVRPGAVAKP
jgi:hypothetical protein